jgi:hypothetical protein
MPSRLSAAAQPCDPLFDYLDTLDLDGGDQDYFNWLVALEKFSTLINASPYISDTLKALL